MSTAAPLPESHREFHARTRTPTWDCYDCQEGGRKRKEEQIAQNRAAGQKRRAETLAKKKLARLAETQRK